MTPSKACPWSRRREGGGRGEGEGEGEGGAEGEGEGSAENNIRIIKAIPHKIKNTVVYKKCVVKT